MLIEVLIGSAIVAGVLVVLAGSLARFNLLAIDNLHKTQAAFLATEGLEAARLLRDISWSEEVAVLVPATSYYLAWQTDRWELSTVPSVIDNRFYRTIEVAEVYRDANNDIASSGTLDPSTYLVTARVSWLARGGTTTKELAAYLTDLFGN